MAKFEVITGLEGVLKGLTLTGVESLAPGECERLWGEHVPDHKKEKPDPEHYTDFIHYATTGVYRGQGKWKRITFLERIPHAFMLGEESYGEAELVAALRQ